VWLGQEAHQHGLVDVLGGMRTAIEKAQELAGLPKNPMGPLLLMKGHPWEPLPPEPWTAEKTLRQAMDASHLFSERVWALSPIAFW
jgi:protease-4